MPAQNFVAENQLVYGQATVDTVRLASDMLGGLGGPIPFGTQVILFKPDFQAIRWRADGVDPTPTVGYPLAAGAEFRFTLNSMSNLRFIGQVAGARVNIYALG